MLDLSWLTQSVSVPVWGLLTLAGYHRVTKILGRATRRRRDREEGPR